MSHVYVEAVVGNPRKSKVKRLKVLVDTGATHTLVSPAMAEELGLTILGESYVTLADGSKRQAGVTLASVKINGRSEIVRVRVFDVDEPVVGVSTFEDLGLTVDPISGRIETARTFTARA